MRKRLFLNGFLVLVVIGAGIGTYFTVHSSSSSAATTQTLASAKRGNVLQSVTSTGNVAAPTTLSLSFQQSGQVTKIFVTAGEHVVAGQALAQVDDTAQKLSLASAQAGLASAQASLAALIRGETPIQRQADQTSVVSAQQSITTAEQGLANAQRNAANNVTKYQAAIAQAEQSVTQANGALATAQAGLQQAQNSLASLQQTADPASVGSGKSSNEFLTRYQLAQTQCGTPPSAGSTASGVVCAQVSNLLTFVKNVQSAESNVSQAQNSVTQAQNGVTSAKQAQISGDSQDQQSIQQAQDQLTSAQNQYQATLVNNAVKEAPPLPEQLAQSHASITSAQTQLQTAQKNESETTLTAPVAGVVASINGLVGQQSGSGGSSSSASSGSSSGSASSSSSAASSSSSGFITLTNINLLDVSVGFTETDAPNVHVGQAATITLAALPNQTFTGHVIAVDTNSTLVSNVVTYYAKVRFDTTPLGVKPGMTASVNVVLATRDNVVTLPTSAVSTTGTSQTVTVKPAHGAESTKVITIGLRGDTAVEITSGLNVGDQVVITNSASTSSAGGGFRLGGGGLGGGGLGGGGLGGGGLGGGAGRGG